MIRFINRYFMFDPHQWHHLYTGILLWIAGITLLLTGRIGLGVALTNIGAWMILDDVGQHRLQRVYNDPGYYSYGHYLGKPFYHLRRYLIRRFGWKWLNWF